MMPIKWLQMFSNESIYNNLIVNLASGVAYMGCGTGKGRAQADRLRAGVWGHRWRWASRNHAEHDFGLLYSVVIFKVELFTDFVFILLNLAQLKLIALTLLMYHMYQSNLTKGRIAGGRFFTGQCNMTLTTWGGIELSLLLHTPQKRLLMLFSGPENPQNCPFPWGSRPRLIHCTLDPHGSASKRHLDRFSHFCGAHLCAPSTHRPCCVRYL